MDLEPIESWLKLNQQPYPLVNEFLKQLSSYEIKQDVAPLIDHWLDKHQATINHSELKKSLAWLEQPNHYLISYLLNNIVNLLKLFRLNISKYLSVKCSWSAFVSNGKLFIIL